MTGTAKLHVLLLVGGPSPEHPISLRSGATALEGLEAAGHRVTLVGITRGGLWVLGDSLRAQLEAARTRIADLDADGLAEVALVRAGSGPRLIATDGGPLPDRGHGADDIDIVFPMVHGAGGEDGAMQGLLDLVGLPYVGAGRTASAVAMDKLVMKTLCASAGIPQVEFLWARDDDAEAVGGRVAEAFGYPCFVKPANGGSSVGVTRVAEPAAMAAALDEARRYDRRVLVERGCAGREVEIAILGSEPGELSPPGEILPADGIYDFDSKYVDSTAGLRVPTELPPKVLADLQRIALEAWELIGGRGMARADFFVEHESGRVLLNEINTIPGFTSISMYPSLWAAGGLALPDLVDRLLRLGLEGR